MNLWLKIKILLGFKKAICKDCQYCLHGGWCTKKGKTTVNCVTGEKSKEYPFCETVNTDGRCLGFKDGNSQ